MEGQTLEILEKQRHKLRRKIEMIEKTLGFDHNFMKVKYEMEGLMQNSNNTENDGLEVFGVSMKTITKPFTNTSSNNFSSSNSTGAKCSPLKWPVRPPNKFVKPPVKSLNLRCKANTEMMKNFKKPPPMKPKTFVYAAKNKKVVSYKKNLSLAHKKPYLGLHSSNEDFNDLVIKFVDECNNTKSAAISSNNIDESITDVNHPISSQTPFDWDNVSEKAQTDTMNKSTNHDENLSSDFLRNEIDLTRHLKDIQVTCLEVNETPTVYKDEENNVDPESYNYNNQEDAFNDNKEKTSLMRPDFHARYICQSPCNNRSHMPIPKCQCCYRCCHRTDEDKKSIVSPMYFCAGKSCDPNAPLVDDVLRIIGSANPASASDAGEFQPPIYVPVSKPPQLVKTKNSPSRKTNNTERNSKTGDTAPESNPKRSIIFKDDQILSNKSATGASRPGAAQKSTSGDTPSKKASRNQPVRNASREQPVRKVSRDQPVRNASRNQPIKSSYPGKESKSNSRNEPSRNAFKNQQSKTSSPVSVSSELSDSGNMNNISKKPRKSPPPTKSGNSQKKSVDKSVNVTKHVTIDHHCRHHYGRPYCLPDPHHCYQYCCHAPCEQRITSPILDDEISEVSVVHSHSHDTCSTQTTVTRVIKIPAFDEKRKDVRVTFKLDDIKLLGDLCSTDVKDVQLSIDLRLEKVKDQSTQISKDPNKRHKRGHRSSSSDD